MTTTPAKETLGTALLQLQKDLPKVHKGNTADIPTKGGGSYRYKYADLADVSAALTPALLAVGLVFTARPRQAATGNGYELVGVLRHAPSGDTEEGALPLFGRDMQEIGGSITYARRYLMGCMTGLITDDDEDNAWTRTPERTVPDTAPAAQAPPLPEPRPLATTQDADALAATASILGDLEQIAAAQTPPRDLAWITSKLRNAAGGLDVAALYSLDPAPLEALLHRWQGRG